MQVPHWSVFRAGCDDVLKEGIPLDIQHVALMTTNFWVMGVQAARLKEKTMILH